MHTYDLAEQYIIHAVVHTTLNASLIHVIYVRMYKYLLWSCRSSWKISQNLTNIMTTIYSTCQWEVNTNWSSYHSIGKLLLYTLCNSNVEFSKVRTIFSIMIKVLNTDYI